ncbi:hypothetical protein KK137_16300 [Croceibacterium sp. LX-88]|jgi:hypothetical protein|uniref:Phage shock protein B n=1 Tax=Croceibacterium selenioxidans TaxID=2838833 RepID=A0ABS5W8B9_9SPHN|nr:hypothetical protein [Croceibacterium selenioxidans]MBT2135899.1 hypothetical protein [Croceibacterium selenioxidans]
MDFFPFMIPIFALSIPIVAIISKHRERVERMRIEAGARYASSNTDKQDGRMEMLEDRVAVLERIVTDRGLNIAAQIEALRDQRGIDDALAAREARPAARSADLG